MKLLNIKLGWESTRSSTLEFFGGHVDIALSRNVFYKTEDLMRDSLTLVLNEIGDCMFRLLDES